MLMVRFFCQSISSHLQIYNIEKAYTPTPKDSQLMHAYLPLHPQYSVRKHEDGWAQATPNAPASKAGKPVGVGVYQSILVWG